MRAGMHWPRVDDLEYNCIYAFDINSSFNFNLIPDPNPMKLSIQVSQFEKLFVMWILAYSNILCQKRSTREITSKNKCWSLNLDEIYVSMF